ncbi:Pyruvate/Phosphoenolpyruvate kinase-like domain-containing protein [Ilyonectria sp. MPI-CAGE-AT-0026]|nr:Pyruvate/Phosphoenolpyruvate kinase-like domain-containing protein [Ilyonectria sp. MPI-CAGE-AT-0026]
MATAPSLIRRALLYVPGASQKMLAKTQALKIDTVIYDLEDSVAPDAKAAARGLVARHLADTSMSSTSRSPREVAVRINAVDTGLALEDLTEVLKSGDNLDTIVVPKVQGPEDLHFVADVVRHVAPHRSVRVNGSESPASKKTTSRPLNILALIESARGLSDINSICRAAHTTGLSGLAFAAEDFATELGLSRLPDRRELLFARSSIVTAAFAHNLPSVIDLVSTGVPSDGESRAALEHDSLEGRALGFTGKQCIHPLQVEIVQKAFGPSGESLRWAVRVQQGDAAARSEGKGAWKLDGKMIDAPIVKRALVLLERARLCGIDITEFE